MAGFSGLIYLLSFLWPFVSQSALAYNSDAVLCPLNEYIDDEDQTVKEYYECPSPDDPPDFTVCCRQDQCCQLRHVDSILGLDLKIAMIISLVVIGLCVILGVTVIVCCFAHPCPLYDTCSGKLDFIN